MNILCIITVIGALLHLATIMHIAREMKKAHQEEISAIETNRTFIEISVYEASVRIKRSLTLSHKKHQRDLEPKCRESLSRTCMGCPDWTHLLCEQNRRNKCRRSL